MYQAVRRARRATRSARRLVSCGLLACGLLAPVLGAQDNTQAGAQVSTPARTWGDSLVGRLVPTFGWPAMGDSVTIISPLSLQGRVVLIDLWGTWCAPCRREMPFLHEAYARFRTQGFEIVSVAFDVSPGKVAAYRRDHFPMPWQHVFATSDIEVEATRIFRVDNFPRTVLLDRDGRVLRVDAGLRGPALAATLDSVFDGRITLPR